MRIEICNIKKSEISKEDALFLSKLIEPYGYEVCDLKSREKHTIDRKKYLDSLHYKLEHFLKNNLHQKYELPDYTPEKLFEIYRFAESEFEKAEYKDDKNRMKLISNFLDYIDTRFDGIFNEQSLRKKSVF